MHVPIDRNRASDAAHVGNPHRRQLQNIEITCCLQSRPRPHPNPNPTRVNDVLIIIIPRKLKRRVRQPPPKGVHCSIGGIVEVRNTRATAKRHVTWISFKQDGSWVQRDWKATRRSRVPQQRVDDCCATGLGWQKRVQNSVANARLGLESQRVTSNNNKHHRLAYVGNLSVLFVQKKSKENVSCQ
jgi:hypothetical protein